MKLIISYEDRYRPDSTGVYFGKAFKELLGQDNVGHVYPEYLNKLTGKEADLYVKIDDGLEQNRFPSHLHPSAYYIIDSHIDLEWRQKLANEGKFDKLFFAQKAGMLQTWYTESKYWVPLGCDKDLHYVWQRSKEYDVCFIGHFHSRYASERIEYMDALFKANPNFFYSNQRTFKEMTEKNASSHIVANKSLNQDINMRFFEGMCSGSVLLTDHIPEMDTLGFKHGVDYYGYTDKQDMLDKAERILHSYKESEWVASNGMKKVHEGHTYKDRCKQILKDCGF